MIINFRNLGAGGSGTTDYTQLTNKPQINSVELAGNKSLEDLGIQPELIAGSGINITNNVISTTGGTDIVYVTSANTFNDVTNILNNNQLPVLVYDNYHYVYNGHYTGDTESYIFVAKAYSEYILYVFYLYTDNEWHKVNVNLQKQLTAGDGIDISGATISAKGLATKVEVEDLELSVAGALNLKQNTLIPGTGIEISGNTISVTGGTGGGLEVVDYDDIDETKALEIYANPEKYAIKLDNGEVLLFVKLTGNIAYYQYENIYNIVSRIDFHQTTVTISSTGIITKTQINPFSYTAIETDELISNTKEKIESGEVVAGMAKQLQSPDGVEVNGNPYIKRTTAGDASVTTGYANLKKVMANTIADEPVYEGASAVFNSAERFTVELDDDFLLASETTYTYTEGVWSPELPTGVTINGVVLEGDSFTINKGLFDYRIEDSNFADPNTSVIVDLTASGTDERNGLNNGITHLILDGNNHLQINGAGYLYIGSQLRLKITGTQTAGDYINVYLNKYNIAYNRVERINPVISIDLPTFGAAVEKVPGTYSFEYDGTDWTPAIADYGITVTGDIYDGDGIDATYIEKDYGHLLSANPTDFYALGFNSFDKSGVWSTILENKTIDATGAVVDETGSYVCLINTVPGLEDGYVVFSESSAVTRCAIGDGEVYEVAEGLVAYTTVDKPILAIATTDVNGLCAHPRWSGIKDEEYEDFKVFKFEIPANDADGNVLPEFIAVGNTRNEYDFENKKYIQRVESIPATEELIQLYRTAKVWGEEYVFDDDYIYQVLDTPVEFDLAVDSNLYWADDFSIEGFEGIDTGVGALTDTWYMANLVDKLRRDVVTKDDNVNKLTAVPESELPETAEDGDTFVLAKNGIDFYPDAVVSTTSGYNSRTIYYKDTDVPNYCFLEIYISYSTGSYWKIYTKTPGVLNVKVSASSEINIGDMTRGNSGRLVYELPSGNYYIDWDWTNGDNIIWNGQYHYVKTQRSIPYYYYYDEIYSFTTKSGSLGEWFGYTTIDNYNEVNAMSGISTSYHYHRLSDFPTADYHLATLSYFSSGYAFIVVDKSTETIKLYGGTTSNLSDATLKYTISHNAPSERVNLNSCQFDIEWKNNHIYFKNRGNYDYNRVLNNPTINEPHYILYGGLNAGDLMTTVSGIPRFDKKGNPYLVDSRISNKNLQINQPAGGYNFVYYYGSGSNGFPNFYAPTAAGTSGQILKSNGGGAPTWDNPANLIGGVTFWTGTQEEYDELGTYSDSIVYLIKEDE